LLTYDNANLNITATSSSPFNIVVTDLGVNADNTWKDSKQSWLIAKAINGGSITGWALDKFNITTSGLTGLPSGASWNVSQVSGNLVLNYVPEPGTLGLLAFGALGLLGRRRRDRR
jgi:hypothetical protein